MIDINTKIDCMIIGAQKAGTTSLKKYLGEHPQITTHEHIEFAFFADDKEYKLGFEKIFKKYFPILKCENKNKIVVKNATLYQAETNIFRLYEHNPNCLVVLILRNPIDRAYSAYQMGVFDGWIDIDFDLLVKQLLSNTIDKDSEYFMPIFGLGFYDLMIPNIQKYFSKGKIKIFKFEQLEKDAITIAQSIFAAIGVDNTFKPNTERKYNVTCKAKSLVLSKFSNKIQNKNNLAKIYLKKILSSQFVAKAGVYLKQINKTKENYEAMNPETRKMLVNYYKQHNENLSKLVGIDFQEWNQ